MHPPGADVVLIRYGDIGVKSAPVQRRMEATLRENLSALLVDRGIEGDVTTERTRLYIETAPDTIESATTSATDAFGVVSASPATRVDADLDTITSTLAEMAPSVYQDGSFAVRARRAGPSDAHPFTSGDIERDGGDRIWRAVEDDIDPQVDLDAPDRTFYVECRRDKAYIFLEKRTGPGGLPLRSQKPLVAMISGGIDSPVAAWFAMKRGSPVIPLYFDFGDFGGVDHVARAEESITKLARFAPNTDMRPRVVPAGPFATELVETVTSTRMLSLRRFMFAVANQVAAEYDAVGIVTGEALGQKSSQTAANLAVTDASSDLPVHRPLLAMDKQEIISHAKRIGTYAGATIPAGCNRIAPTRPSTAASLERVVAAEPPLEPWVDEAMAALEIFEPMIAQH